MTWIEKLIDDIFRRGKLAETEAREGFTARDGGPALILAQAETKIVAKLAETRLKGQIDEVIYWINFYKKLLRMIEAREASAPATTTLKAAKHTLELTLKSLEARLANLQKQQARQ